jgi:hypothetical protein
MSRIKPLYIEWAGWIGFGRADPQLDLFESSWRLGWWRVSLCRVCLVTTIQMLRAAIDDAAKAIERRQAEGVGSN